MSKVRREASPGFQDDAPAPRDFGGFRFRCGNHYHVKARLLRQCREAQLGLDREREAEEADVGKPLE